AADDSGGKQMQREAPAAELDGVAGVVGAVVPGDHVEAVPEQLHDLALAFVAPLSAHDGQDLHVVSPRAGEQERRLAYVSPLAPQRPHGPSRSPSDERGKSAPCPLSPRITVSSRGTAA